MKDFLNTLKSRSTIRKYLDKDLSQEQITSLLESVQLTQSWANTQCWDVIVVKDQAQKEALAGTYPKYNTAGESTRTAPVVFALCASADKTGLIRGEEVSPHKEWYMFDTGLAAANLTNTAYAMGLGSVIAGWFDFAEASKLLNVPEDKKLVALIPVGYPAEPGRSPGRKNLEEFVFEEMYPAG